MMPLTDPNEMANADLREVGERIRRSPEAALFRTIVSAPGRDVFDDPQAAGEWAAVALATFEQSRNDFHPFTSKFDFWLIGEVELTPQEERGFDLFNNPQKGNCASCHPDGHKSASAPPPLFTDFGYSAIGVPRNRTLDANRDPTFHDLGLCGPLRTDLASRPEYCGSFRTPSLRNVALRQAFFHNGSIHSLRDAVAFYARRDTDPAEWYSRGKDGEVEAFDDLPKEYWVNLERGVPFEPLRDGRPRLDDADIDAIVAFLRTLTDGYVVPGREPPA